MLYVLDVDENLDSSSRHSVLPSLRTCRYHYGTQYHGWERQFSFFLSCVMYNRAVPSLTGSSGLASPDFASSLAGHHADTLKGTRAGPFQIATRENVVDARVLASSRRRTGFFGSFH